MVDFAATAGFKGLEVAVGPHVDVQASPESLKAAAERVRAAGLQITSLAAYMNTTPAGAAEREAVIQRLKAAVDAAAVMGVSVVCTLAGHPVPGKDKNKTIEEDVPQVLGPVVRYAAEKGIKIALENWFATNIQHLGHWERIFRVIPDANFGLNYDPSHLYWQGIDYIAAIDRFADRIFHVHAKDVEIREHVLRWVGNQAGGWWRYVIPGFGRIHWGELAHALRRNGYDGVLSIEHEDGSLGVEEGFLKGLQHLQQYL